MIRYIIIAITCFGLASASAQKKIETVEIKTSAICEMCKHTIEYDLTFAKGIKFVELDPASKVVTVSFNVEKTSAEAIRERITQLGYHADSLVRDSVAYENLPFCCKEAGHHGN